MTGTIVLDVRGIPEVIQAVRAECAEILRDDAESESNPAVARRLRQIASAFEAGQRPEDD